MANALSPERVCSACGMRESDYHHPLVALPLRTILSGQYLVGRVLGQGGFGITYLGIDLRLELKVAIKEFFPTSLSSRNANSTTLSVHEGDSREHFQYHLKKFLEEGRAIARFNDNPCIVSVLGFLEANNTGYLIMNYLEGRTLKEFLAERGGKISYQETADILAPVMDGLAEVHKHGLLHRDISPDNIMITNEGQVKLFDFGAVRILEEEQQKSVAVVFKRGFAPEEQYRGVDQGPWTDVYALGATFYTCLTGCPPPDSLQRLSGSTMPSVSDLRKDSEVSARVEAALLKSLAIKAADRYQSVREMQHALIGEAPLPPPPMPGPIPGQISQPTRLHFSPNTIRESISKYVRPLTETEAGRRKVLLGSVATLFLFIVLVVYGLTGIDPLFVGHWQMQVNEGGHMWDWRFDVARSGNFSLSTDFSYDGKFDVFRNGSWRSQKGMPSDGTYKLPDEGTMVFSGPPLAGWVGELNYTRTSPAIYGPDGNVYYTGTWENSDTLVPGVPGKRTLTIRDDGTFTLTAHYAAKGSLETKGNAYKAKYDFGGVVARGTFSALPNNDASLFVQENGKPPVVWTKIIE